MHNKDVRGVIAMDMQGYWISYRIIYLITYNTATDHIFLKYGFQWQQQTKPWHMNYAHFLDRMELGMISSRNAGLVRNAGTACDKIHAVGVHL